MGDFTATYVDGRGSVVSDGKFGGRRMPSIASVATSQKSVFTVLDTKGQEREARRFVSITSTSVPFTRNCVLKGPVISSAFAMRAPMAFTRSIASRGRFLGGSTSVASPECTPAFSMCSLTACATIFPSFATASSSTCGRRRRRRAETPIRHAPARAAAPPAPPPRTW